MNIIHNIHILILNDYHINVIYKNYLTKRHYCSTIVLQCFMNMFQVKSCFVHIYHGNTLFFYITVILTVQLMNIIIIQYYNRAI